MGSQSLTFDHPSRPGYYWFQPAYSEPRVVEVIRTGDRWHFLAVGSAVPQRIMPGVGRWAGPIPEPTE